MRTSDKTIWRKVRLGEVAGVLGGFAFPSALFHSEKNGFPVVKISNIADGEIDIQSIEYVDAKKVDRDISKFMLTKGDFVVAMTGATAGKVGKLNSDRSFFLNQRVGKFFLKDENILDKKFLYYSVINPRNKNTLKKLADGSAQGNMSSSQIEASLEIDLPENVSVQKRIAEVLSVFDDKIENNNRIIKTLEEMAQAIFKEWFVENTSGKKIKLTDMAEFINGGAFGKVINRSRRGLPLVKIAEFSRGITENSEWVDKEVSEKYLIKDGDLLFSWSGSLELHIWHRGNAVLNQHLFNVIPQIPYTRGMLYVVLQSLMPWFRQIAQSKATSMGHIQRRHLEEQEVLISDKDIGIFDDLYQKLAVLMIENQKLAALRDLLLPKLMSGEIRV